VLGRIIQQILPALEAIAELGQPPRCNDLDIRLQRVETQLETDLVVALARATMRYKVAVLLLGNADLGAGNDGAGKRGAEEVAAFIGRVALDGAEAELLDEFLLKIEDDLGRYALAFV
jgi:hypothetical protein